VLLKGKAKGAIKKKRGGKRVGGKSRAVREGRRDGGKRAWKSKAVSAPRKTTADMIVKRGAEE